MANDLFATGGLSVEARNWYEKRLISTLYPYFCYNKYATKKGIPANGGNNLQFRQMQRITTSTTALTEGTPPSNTNATFTQVLFTVNQYGQYARLSDVAIKQSQDDLMGEYTTNFGQGAADAIDQLLRAQVVAGTTVQYARASGSRPQIGSGDWITAAEIRHAVRTLARSNVPKLNGKYVCIMHPDARHDFFADSNVINAYQYTGPRDSSNPLFSGELFDWMGVMFEISTNAAVVSSAGFSGADVYQTIVFGDGAYASVEYDTMGLALLVKPLGSAGANDPLNQFATVGWKATWAGGILDQTRLVRIEHAASISSMAGAQARI